MTIEERKERFMKFDGCRGNVCDECGYKSKYDACVDLVAEDARALLRYEADEKTIKNPEPYKFNAPLSHEERDQILELIRVKTDVPDISAHFIQEINELCSELNNIAATVGKMEQIIKGTDPVGEHEAAEKLVEAIPINIADMIEELADVFNYLAVLGYDDHFKRLPEAQDEKLARWANRLNGVSDE